MHKLTNTAKKLDIFFRIFQIASHIGWIAALVGFGVLLAGVVFRLDPEAIGTGYNSLELGFVELQIAQTYVPNNHMILLQMGVVLALSGAFLFVSWLAVKQVRGILSPMIQGEPFRGIVGTGLKKLAGYSLVLGIIGNITLLAEQLFTVLIFDVPSLLLGEKITHVNVNYEFDLTFLVFWAVLMLTSYVFRYGEQLQQLSDETL